MGFSKVYSAQTSLLNAQVIDIEVDLSSGMYAFSIVGLPDKAVEESRDRISAAIKNSGYESPKSKNQKTVISLAPADIKKEGPFFDLAIAIAYLKASGELVFDPAGKLFLGELSLDGELRKINGTLALVQGAKLAGFSEIFVPQENADEAALIGDVTIYGARTLGEVVSHLKSEQRVKKAERAAKMEAKAGKRKDEGMEYDPGMSGPIELLSPHVRSEALTLKAAPPDVDFSDIKGQTSAKRGLEIAAAGGHNLAMYGPPGTGKTMPLDLLGRDAKSSE